MRRIPTTARPAAPRRRAIALAASATLLLGAGVALRLCRDDDGAPSGPGPQQTFAMEDPATVPEDATTTSGREAGRSEVLPEDQAEIERSQPDAPQAPDHASGLEDLRRQIREGAPSPAVAIPSTKAQRDAVLHQLDLQTADLDALCAKLRDRAWARVPADASSDTRTALARAIDTMARSEYAYRIEVVAAVKNHVATGDLAQPAQRPRRAEGKMDSRSMMLQGPEWGADPVMVEVQTFVDFGTNATARNAHARLLADRQILESLLATAGK